MGYLETHSRPPAGQVRGKLAEQADLRTQAAQCLIVSGSSLRREMLSQAAADAGWDTVVCANESSATAAVHRTRFQMAWIDLDIPAAADTAAYRELCQTLAASRGLLLAICGHIEQPEEEIWARQLGVWLYLPGISMAHVDEISLLCEQARQITGKPQPTQ